MHVGKIVAGVVLGAIAIWVFATMADPTGKYFGAGVLAIIAATFLVKGFQKTGQRQ